MVFGVTALSTSAIFVRLANAPSSVTAFYRLFFALLCLIPFVIFSKKRRSELLNLPKKTFLLCICAGFLLAVHYIMWFESLKFTSVASSTVLATLQPLFSIVLAYIILKEKQSKTALTGCAIALIGSFIIGFGDFSLGERALFGDIIALLSAGVISGYFFIGQIVRKTTSALVYSAVGYFSSCVFLAIYTLICSESFTGYPTLSWLSFLGLAFIATILGQFVFNALLKWVSATSVAMGILAEPVATSILAYFILDENVSVKQLLGIAVILSGIGIYSFSDSIQNKLFKKQA